METMVRGSLKPDLEVTLADADGEADFSLLTTADVRVVGEMDGVIVFDDSINSIVASTDKHSAVIRRAWDATDVDLVGRMWIDVVVDWGGGKLQHFPHEGPLRLDFVRAAGDA
jgi:hypothetical protein